MTTVKTWVILVTLERKVNSLIWKHPLSPTDQIKNSAKKLIAIVFWDAVKTLDILREVIFQMRAEQLHHDSVIMLHKNATPHMANFIKSGTSDWNVLPYPLQNLDSDYHLFGCLK